MTLSAILSTAASGMQTSSQRVFSAANALSSTGLKPVSDTQPSSDAGPEDPLKSMTSMIEASHAFEANATVFETGADLWQVLSKIVRD